MSAIDYDALSGAGELTLDDILSIEQAGSEKGIYQRDLLDFVHSGKLGVPYKFEGKAAQSVKMGFTSAVEGLQKKDDVSAEDKEAVKHVEVRVRKVKGTDGAEDKEFVFLINQKVVATQRGTTATDTPQAENGVAPATTDNDTDEE